MAFGTFSFTVFEEGYKKFLDPPHTNNLGGIKVFRPPPQNLQTKHKKWIYSATVHLTRKRFIFPGRYLKADHFENKIGHGWWAIQKC